MSRPERERAMVPRADFRSYYGRAVIKKPVWRWDIPAYFFTGGVMAGSSLLAAGADLVGYRQLRRVTRLTAMAGLGASSFFLVRDLGRPERFYNMLRVLRPTSPMSVGTWIIASYGPAAAAAAASDVTGFAPGVGRLAGLAAAALAPAVATYTAVLTADTAVPAWHDAYLYLPFLFAGSAAAASGGIAAALAPAGQTGPARRLATLGAAVELATSSRMKPAMGLSAEPYKEGTAAWLDRAARQLTATGLVATLLGRRNRAARVAAGAALAAGSLCTRLAVFHAGVQSASDPRYTVVPQRDRLDSRTADATGAPA